MVWGDEGPKTPSRHRLLPGSRACSLRIQFGLLDNNNRSMIYQTATYRVPSNVDGAWVVPELWKTDDPPL